MKYLSIITIILFTYPCKGHETKVDKIESLNSDSTKYSLVGIWNKLTINKKDTIIYQPCDANNTSIKVTRDSVIIDYGQEILSYFILEKNNYNNKCIEFKLSGTNNKLECIINNKTTAFWIINGTKSLFTRSDISKFKTVEQPCIECWGEDECNNQEDTYFYNGEQTIAFGEKDIKKYPEIIKPELRWDNSDAKAIPRIFQFTWEIEGEEMIAKIEFKEEEIFKVFRETYSNHPEQEAELIIRLNQNQDSLSIKLIPKGEDPNTNKGWITQSQIKIY